MLYGRLCCKCLKDDHIAEVHAYTTSGWLVMELAQGNLKEMCAHSHSLTYEDNYALLEQAAAGVSCAHGHDLALVHSDVKTANFFVFGNRSDGLCVKLSDFGWAFELSEDRSKSIRRGGYTPNYVAPEFYKGQLVCPESDMYSFAGVMHEILSGKMPYSWCKDIYSLRDTKLEGKRPCAMPADCPLEADLLLKCCCLQDQQQANKPNFFYHVYDFATSQCCNISSSHTGRLSLRMYSRSPFKRNLSSYTLWMGAFVSSLQLHSTHSSQRKSLNSLQNSSTALHVSCVL